MKKIGLFIIGLCTIFLAGNFTQAKDYEYTNLDITANILIDGTIDVKEDFTADFFVSKHGIIRDIPLNYSVGGKDFHIEVSNINVQGKTFKTSKSNGNIEIKIGDADRTVIGKQNYPIYYSTYGLIRNFSGMGYAELYWNLVGYDFDTNINKVRAELTLPKVYTGFTANDFLITTDGKSKTIDGFDGTVDWSKGDRIIITYDKGLSAKHGITLAVKFPNNYFKFDHDKQADLIGFYKENPVIKLWKNITNFIKSYFWEGSLIIMFLFGLLLEILRKIKEKSIFRRYPIIIQYSPPKGLNCAEVGFIYNRGVKISQIISLIYKRASEGIILLKNTGEKICIIKNKDLKSEKNSSYSENYDVEDMVDEIYRNMLDKKSINNQDYENYIFKFLFGNREKIYIPNKHFNLNLSGLEEYFGLCCKQKNWINEDSRYDYIYQSNAINIGPLRGWYILIFFIILFVAANNGNLYLILWSMTGLALSILLGIIHKPTLTDEGYRLLSEIKGYRNFIKACNERQIKKFLSQDPLFFDKTLPYAVTLGLETKFMKNFKPIMEEMGISQNWCTGDLTDIIRFVNDGIHIESQSTSSGSSSSSSYSSSGGFSGGSSFSGGGSSFSSGGGGGGGGGRSW